MESNDWGELHEGDDLVLICCVYFVIVDLQNEVRPSCQAGPRDDAGGFDTNHIGPKKRLAYETGSEMRFERVANT